MAKPVEANKHSAGFGKFWQCNECKKRYSTKGQCLTHIVNVHKK
jgi:hypothetical protein